MKKIQSLKKRLKNKDTIILDGALGTEIQRRGISTKLPLWSAECLFTNKKLVKDIHADYIKNGAEIITTNTFRTTARTFRKVNRENDAKESVLIACKLAKEAASQFPDKEIYIAGSVAPLEDCYTPELTPSDHELAKEHLEYISHLKEGGVDFILIETMITIRETIAALKATQKLELPVAVSFCVDEKGDLLGGESLKDAVKAVELYDPLFISINCVQPDIATATFHRLKKLTNIPLGIYANGEGHAADAEGWEFTGDNLISSYVKYAGFWKKAGAQVIGGCCGTSPEYIKSLKN